MIPHRRKLCATSLTLAPKLDRVALRIVYASKAAGLRVRPAIQIFVYSDA